MPLSFRQTLGCAFLVAVAMVFFELGRSSNLLSICDTTNTEAYSESKSWPISAASSSSSSSSGAAYSFKSSSSSSILDQWESNTVIITISFGKAPETKLLERLVYSIWTNGKWNGPVYVLTDQADAYRERLAQMTATFFAPQVQQQLLNKLIILQAKPEHLHPINPKTGRPIEFVNDAMRFKRFKTLVFDYLDEYYQYQYYPSSPPNGAVAHSQTSSLLQSPPRSTPTSSPYQNVLYLDVEIVLARPVIGFFQDYQDQMIEREVFLMTTTNTSTTIGDSGSSSHDSSHSPVNIVMNHNGTTDVSYYSRYFMSLFSDCAQCVRPNFNLNGGVLLLHSETSRPCLAKWQALFALGATYSTTDQRYLVVIKQEYEKEQKENKNKNDKQQQQQQAHAQEQCKLWQLSDHHRLYPSRKEMRLKRSATIVHNTNTFRARNIPQHVQSAYFTYLLGASASSSGSGGGGNSSTNYFATEKVETF